MAKADDTSSTNSEKADESLDVQLNNIADTLAGVHDTLCRIMDGDDANILGMLADVVDQANHDIGMIAGQMKGGAA